MSGCSVSGRKEDAMKLWSGRFEKNTDALTDALNSSIAFDSRMYREDILGSIAHARMLGTQGIIETGEAEKIIVGLKEILTEIEAGTVEFSMESEDIHMNIETLLTARIGDAGKRLHTARSRNDQVALDIRLYLKKEIPAVREMLVALLKVLAKKAAAHTDTIMPAYTHLQRAQPTTFAHYMMAYASMLRRDVTRLHDCLMRMDEMPLGSGALTSTTYPIDRWQVAGELGFDRITENSLDGVSDRDFVLELLGCLSILMMHLSRFSEELIYWCSWEFKFIELDDSYSTGSSIMPQKKNPDIAELVRGKTGRVYGSLVTLLTVMKALPLAYNKDMQEDKEALFDALDTVKACLPVFTAIGDTMKLLPLNMRKSAGAGFINATDCADYLVRKGLPFREAYTIVGKLVQHCLKEEQTLETLPLADYKAGSPLFDDDIYSAIALEACVNARNAEGGPSKQSVLRQIASIERFIDSESHSEF
jgi:argininosuccinate lyase